MKKIKLLTLSCALFLVPVIANASEDSSLKIAVVNIQKLEQDTDISKDLQKKIAKKEKEVQENLLKKKNKLESDYKSIESKKAVLSREELEKKVRKLQEDAQKLDMDGKMAEQTFQLARLNVAQEIQEVMSKAVNKIADDKYDLVIPNAMALYINNKKFDDITSKVADKMDDIQKSVNFDKAFNKAKEQVEKMVKGGK